MVVLERLKNLRERRALSQGALAARAGVSRQTVLKVEGGRPVSPDTLRKLADALGLEPGVLIDGQS